MKSSGVGLIDDVGTEIVLTVAVLVLGAINIVVDEEIDVETSVFIEEDSGVTEVEEAVVDVDVVVVVVEIGISVVDVVTASVGFVFNVGIVDSVVVSIIF